MRLPFGLARKACGQTSRILHLPDDLLDPSSIAVIAGSSGYDIWTALFLMNSIEKSLPAASLSMIASVEDEELLGLLPRPPRITAYALEGRRRRLVQPESLPEAEVVFGISERHDASISHLMKRYPDSIRVFARPDECANVVLNLSAVPAPARMHSLIRLLGVEPDENWKPIMLRGDMAKAASLLSPVSGTVLPYMAATGRVAGILRKQGAEMPMRVVLLDGRNNPVLEGGVGLRAAVIAGATAVGTDDPAQWAQACAMGIPAIGLDRKSTFPQWGRTPSRDSASLASAWDELLRTGW